MISPIGGYEEGDPAHHHKQAGGYVHTEDRLNGPTFDLTNKPEEKYTDRLNGPTFDLTYRGHEEGHPAHHHEHG